MDNLPVATCNVDGGQGHFVWEVVDIYELPAKTLVFPSKMDFVKDDDVDEVHGNSGEEKIAAERWSDNE